MDWVEKSRVFEKLYLSETRQGDSHIGSAFLSQTSCNVYNPEFALKLSRIQGPLPLQALFPLFMISK